MYEEKKENQAISSSDVSQEGDITEETDTLNLTGCEPVDENKKFVTVKFKIPLEFERKLKHINISKSKDEVISYLLDQLKQFFAERNAQIPLTTKPTETSLKSPEKRLKITYEDQEPRKIIDPYHERSPFRAAGMRPESSRKYKHEDSSKSSSTIERSLSPIIVLYEPLPSFDSTFGRPLRHLYNIPFYSVSMPPESEIPQTSTPAESLISSETYASLAMDSNRTVHDASVDTAINLSNLLRCLLQDLEELKKFLEGFPGNSGEPSTSGNATSFAKLAAISKLFGTGIESNAAISSRDYLREVESSIDSFVEELSLSDCSVVNPVHQAVTSQARRATPQFSPVSLKGKANGSPKKSQTRATGTPSTSKKSYTLKSWIENRTITQTAIDLRHRIAIAQFNFQSCAFNAADVLSLGCKNLPEEIVTNLEILVAGCVNILQELVKLRRECSFLLQGCQNRHNNEGITYILKVKTQIAIGCNELTRLLLQRLLTFRVTCDRYRET